MYPPTPSRFTPGGVGLGSACCSSKFVVGSPLPAPLVGAAVFRSAFICCSMYSTYSELIYLTLQPDGKTLTDLSPAASGVMYASNAPAVSGPVPTVYCKPR